MQTRSRSDGSFSVIKYPRPWKMFLCTANCCSASQTLGWVNQTPGEDVDYVGEKRAMSDVVVPNFRKRVAAGEIFMNFMTSTKRTLHPSSTGAGIDYLTNGWNCGSGSAYRYKTRVNIPGTHAIYGLNIGLTPDSNGSWGIPTGFTTSEINNLIEEANTECLDKRGRADFNLFETIAERREAYRLLSSYLKSADKALERINFATNGGIHLPKRLRSLGQATAEAYLITRYGLSPLISDFRAVLAAWEKTTGKIRQTVRGTKSIGRSVQTAISPGFSSSYSTAMLQLVTEEFTARAMSLDEYNVTVAQNYGFSAKGLITLPWELLTLSFVADWFLNIGAYLGAMVPSPHVDQLGSCIVLQRRASLSNTLTGVATPVGVAEVFSAPTGQKVGTVIETTRIPGLRSPSVVVRSRFGLDPSLEQDETRVADGVALLGQRLLTLSKKLDKAFATRHLFTN